jgi:mycofactocin system glycosyltransferase
VPLRATHINEALFELLDGLQRGESQASAILDSKQRSLLDRLVERGVLGRDEIVHPKKLPSVSVIIPVHNRPQDLRDCLHAIEGLDYPREKLEILVINDASTDETVDVIQEYSVRSFRMNRPSGPASCRNFAARKAKGEVLAFLDSDCMPSRGWLMDLIGLLARPGMGAVGGYVDGCFRLTSLDLYEKSCSPLNMGQHEKRAGPDSSSFYLPSCNLLVRKDVFLGLGGFEQDLHVGEDVDFCWRLRKRGYLIQYSTGGRVYHKHRSRLLSMLRRRFDYGTSESILLLRHPEKIKKIPLPRREQMLFAATCFFLLFPAWWTLLPWIATMMWDVMQKCILLRGKRIPQVPPSWVVASTLRWGLLSEYSLAYFLVRYHLIPLLIGGCLFPSLWLLATVLFGIALVGNMLGRRPELSILHFSLFFFLEQLAYQAGVMSGCLKRKTWKPLYFKLNPCT